MVFLGFLYFGDSKILLKESDRGFLTQIAFDNISFLKDWWWKLC